MIHTIKCVVCGHICTARGWEESGTNSAGLHDSETLEDGCVHLKDGGEFEIINSEDDFKD